GGSPVWVVPYRVEDNDVTWFVTLESGASVLVSPSGEVSATESRLNGEPPEIRVGESVPQVVSAYDDLSLFPDALPDSRVVFDGDLAVALVDPTDQYDHAILGDRFEAKAFEVLNRCTGERTRTTVASEDVIEGISPMLADVDGDGVRDVLVTISNDAVGARLSAYRIDGSLLAESEAIGSGGRWRNQLAVAPVGPDEQVEIVDVWQPHANGILEFLRYSNGSLVRVAETAGFTNHVTRTQNVDKGIVADADGDGRLDVVVLTLGLTEVGVLTRAGDEVETIALLPLDAIATTNIAATELASGSIAFAIGTEDGRLRVWGGS
ncbi:MAG: hypothetical protein ACC652_06300, partial [Acidimicrobiales bacterium]